MDDVLSDPGLKIPAQWFRWALAAHGDVFNIERARRMAVDLMEQYGIPDWELRVGGATDRAGYAKSMVDPDTGLFNTPGVITLSGPLMSLWTESQREDTIRHEIAHAISGPHHDSRWVRACDLVGATPTRCWGRDGEARITVRWVGSCPGGHKHAVKTTKPKGRWSCGKCNPNPGAYNEAYRITYSREMS